MHRAMAVLHPLLLLLATLVHQFTCLPAAEISSDEFAEAFNSTCKADDGEIWMGFGDICLWVSDEPMEFWKAQLMCLKMKSHFAYISSEAENMYIAGILTHMKLPSVWIGISSLYTDPYFEWVDETEQQQQQLLYRNFYPGEPKSTGEHKENCLVMSYEKNFKWTSEYCFDKHLYRLPSRISPSRGMPLEVLRRKVKEARQKFLHHTRTSPTSPSKPTQKSKSSSSESSSVSEPPTQVLSTRGSREGVAEPLQQYWGAEEGAAGGEEEIELLQQYLNLQHLARSRKHSAQLRRIRDSLIVKVRSRPNSVVNGGDHTPATSPAHATAPRKDRQQLRDFLLDIGFVQDYSLLNRHGYDLATAAHMDALDLAGAGVTEPLHRMALKHELNLVQRPTQVPDEVPETVEEWLEGLSLQSYVDNFHLNGLYCPLAALNLTKRDLQLMGVYMQGHRKKILLSLAALKETLFRRVNEKDN